MVFISRSCAVKAECGTWDKMRLVKTLELRGCEPSSELWIGDEDGRARQSEGNG